MKRRSARPTRSSSPAREVRADYDRDSIVVYQAYDERIAAAALKAGRLVPPFSYRRMTWIKPSFRWLMVRSQWASKPGQTRVLALRIPRARWEEALAAAVLTDPHPRVYSSAEAWRDRFAAAQVHVQWDPERSLRGSKLTERSIQVGIGRGLVRAYAEDWVSEVRDLTPLAHKLRERIRRGDLRQAKRLLPPERAYPLSAELRRALGAGA